MESCELSSRKDLYANPAFRAAFWALRPRIERMELRFLEIDDWSEVKALEKFAVWILRPRYQRG